MPHLPEFLQPFKTEAEEILAKNLVKDIEFSGGTYQVQVLIPEQKKEVWAFIQLDMRGNLKDCFCSCEEGEELNHCAHLAAAFMRIYNNNPLPLHQRYERSLWNILFQLFADRLGDDHDALTSVSPGHYIHTSASNKTVFFIKAKNQKSISRLQTIIEELRQETEETSIKFSNLSQEEISLWREGRPSHQLRYELSFWSDLAHWMMLLQENKVPYQISFEYSKTNVPNYIKIEFPDIEAGFYISEANLPTIIPALETVNSPLSVHHDSKDTIEKITYDKIQEELILSSKTKEPLKKEKKSATPIITKNEISLKGWLYTPSDGFYEQDTQHLLSLPKLSGEQISKVLNEHARVIKQYLDGTSLYLDPISLSYTLAFDSKWNLHITAYAFDPGDLTTGHSKAFGDWIYLDDDGFYPILKSQFKDLETIIPAPEVSDFVRRERNWLNTQDGFHAHLKSIEAQLTYNLSPQNRLTFARLLPSKEATGESKDFGTWAYVAGQGFYAKTISHTSLPLQPEIVIQADQIPLFIRMNRGELQMVQGFFSEKCPVTKSGIKLALEEKESINIHPQYELLSEYIQKDVRMFDDFVYVDGEGFHELPLDSRLPEPYRHEMIIPPAEVPTFITFTLGSLIPFISEIDARLVTPKVVNLIASNITKESDQNLYYLNLSYETEHGAIPIQLFWNALKLKKDYLFAAEGLIDLNESRFDWIRLIPKNRLDRRSNILTLSTLELIRLNSLDEITVKSEEGSSEVLLKELTEFKVPQEPDLTGLTSQLRPYQKLGSHWLWFLYTHSLSGLLCDDMGLGKTHQSMALLTAVINLFKAKLPTDQKKHGPHFLVVCPTSVMYHWQEKLQAFLPELRICTFYGTERSLKEFHEQYDVLLTSYGIWRIENELLSEIKFEVAIFDEIQIAKNQNSRIHATLCNSKARMRLGLTGTPIENHLRELKSLFDIVLPSYMPTDTDFRELFVKPIERTNDPEKKALLTRFIKPFVLRRKKEEVLPDLPEKIEEISHCTLLPSQRQLYNEVLQQSRQRIMDQMQDGNNPIPYIHIFALLSSLKQICNHPATFLKTPEEYKNYESGKWELFVELLNEARDSQQKVVIFSQYLAMLDIFESYLNEVGIGFSTIRGATINRGEQVHRFNNDPNCEVFLGSLQASGLGVDLTAGSVVIHYDRWWNAARENQATDRVHRIGQTRGVQVFKLVTKNTFEERIDYLIAKKGRLMEDVVGSDDHRLLKRFNREEIMLLLQEVEDAT